MSRLRAFLYTLGIFSCIVGWLGLAVVFPMTMACLTSVIVTSIVFIGIYVNLRDGLF